MPEDGSELIDVLDEQGAPTGISKPRDAIHRDGDWHRAFHLWLVREDHHLLLQRRARSKDLESGKVDVTVGGHYRAGEGINEVVREADEEIGLDLNPVQLSHLGTWKSERVYAHAVDREFQEVYVLVNEQPLDEFQLNCKEVYLLYEVPLERAIALYRDGSHVPVPGFDCQRRENNALLVEDDLIGQARAVTVEALEAIRSWLLAADPERSAD